MDLKVGDKLYCKKDLVYGNIGRICEKGKSYAISRTNSYTICINNDRVAMRLREDRNVAQFRFVWEYFETKQTRAKRIIDGFKNR